MTISTAISLLVSSARSAGMDVSDLTNGDYALANVHDALMRLGNDFQEDTRYIKQLSSLSTTSGNNVLHFSAIVDFTPDRFLAAWIDAQYPIRQTNIGHIIELRRQRIPTGAPTLMAFNGSGSCYSLEDADDDYLMSIHWTPPFTSWTAGSSSVSSTVLNLPDVILRQIIPTGGVAMLQEPEIQEQRQTIPRWQKYVDYRTKMRGEGTLDLGPSRKMSMSEMEALQSAGKWIR